MPPTFVVGEDARSWRFQRAAEVLLAVLGGLVVISTLVVAVVHVDDRFQISQVAGTWMALAQSANDGTFYPPLFDGTHFGGTRYMPLQIALDAGAARASGEYLVSAKIISFASATVLFGLTFFIARRVSRSWPLALALVGTILVTSLGSETVHGVRGDALPAALQLGAVALVLVGSTPAIVVGGVLCGLAFVSKASALWAFIAAVLWLSRTSRRSLAPFLVSAILTALLALIVFEALSHGRMSDNLLALSTSGDLTLRNIVLHSSVKVFDVTTGLVIVPLAIASLALASHRRRIGLYHVSFVVAVLLLVLVLGDVGVAENHALDLAALSAILVAELWGDAAGEEGGQRARLVIVGIVAWALVGLYQTGGLRENTLNALRDIAGKDAPSYPARPLVGVVGAHETILSEDPTIPVSLGQVPVVLDPFMLLRLLRGHSEWQARFVKRIDSRAFAAVVLTEPLDVSDGWFRTNNLGVPVVLALARNYRLKTIKNGYWIYSRRPAT
jgi:hypothetical protein